MNHRKKWASKPHAVLHPRCGQKYRLGQLCAELHKGRKPSLETGELDARFPNGAIKQDYRAYLETEAQQCIGAELRGNPHLFVRLLGGRWTLR
jgi:hypothetical protein